MVRVTDLRENNKKLKKEVAEYKQAEYELISGEGSLESSLSSFQEKLVDAGRGFLDFPNQAIYGNEFIPERALGHLASALFFQLIPRGAHRLQEDVTLSGFFRLGFPKIS